MTGCTLPARFRLAVAALFTLLVGASDPAVAFELDLWKNPTEQVGPETRRALERKMRELGFAEIASGNRMEKWSPPYYPGTSLVRVHGNWQPANLFLYFLVNSDRQVTWLNGTSPPIHRFNARQSPALNAQTAAAYLWFFTFFVRGEEGPFLLIGSPKDTFVPKAGESSNSDTRKALAGLPEPVRCRSATGEHVFRCIGIIYYSNAIFQAEFGLSSSGIVQMLSDKPLAADLSHKIDAPIDPRKLTDFRPSAVDLSGVPAAPRRELQRALEGRDLTLTRENTPFLAGLASGLVERCNAPASTSDRLALSTWAASGAMTGIFGSDYSNPDIGKALGSQAKSMLGMGAGTELAKQVPCGPTAELLAGAILAAVKRQEARGADQESRFIRTCKGRHGNNKCECIAGVVRGTMPDIHQRPYSSRVLKETIKRNPMTGILMMGCGVVRY